MRRAGRLVGDGWLEDGLPAIGPRWVQLTKLSRETVQRLTWIARRVLDMPRSGDRVSSVWQRELDACFATALIVGLKGRDETEPASPTQKGHADVVTAARDYIDAYLDAPLGAETLAREAGVSRRTLEYAFRTVNQHD